MTAGIELPPSAPQRAMTGHAAALDGGPASAIDRWVVFESAQFEDVWRDETSREGCASLDRETIPARESTPVPVPQPLDVPSLPASSRDEAQPIFAVVSAWRAAQRALDGLTESSPSWNRVHAEVVGLRALHHRLFEARLAAAAGRGDGPVRPTLTMMAWGPTWMPAR
jgi:hypothetical protein